MKRPSGPDAALKRLLNEARAERTREVDFDGIEERLLREVRRGRPQASRGARTWAWASVAVAACAALWLTKWRTETTSAETKAGAMEAVAMLERNGDALAVGERVTAAERQVSVTHADRAIWKLDPHASALLAEKGERITLQLERGSVLSEVVRSPRPETFVVEAAGARVAVHGTVFRVSLEGGRVVVQVREGVVGVGPRGGAPLFMLKAPAYGDFAADGRSGTVNGRASGVVESPASERPRPARVRAASSVAAPATSAAVPSPSVSVPLPAEPSISDIESGISRSVELVSDCFERHTQSADGIRVTARTALSLHITSDGKATDVQFQPPLSPEIAACAAEGISSVSFAPSERGAEVTRMLELKR